MTEQRQGDSASRSGTEARSWPIRILTGLLFVQRMLFGLMFTPVHKLLTRGKGDVAEAG